MKKIARISILLIFVAGFTACNNRQSTPQEIRKQAADAAAQVKKDAKEFGKDAEAAAQGIKDGLKRDDPDHLRKPAEKKRPAQ